MALARGRRKQGAKAYESGRWSPAAARASRTCRCSSRGAAGQGHGEAGALAKRAFDTDRTTLDHDEPLDEGETETRPLIAAAEAAVHLVKRCKQAR